MKKSIKAEANPMFSARSRPKQPDVRAVRRPARTGWLRPGMAIAALLAGSCGVFLLIARANDAQNLPQRAKKTGTVHTSKPIQVAENEKSAASAAPVETSRRSLDFYTKGVRDSMFSAPQPPKPKAVAVAAPKPAKPVQVPVVNVNPFADWTYSGTVSMGDEKMALLENRNTKEGQYLKAGDTFIGAKVGTVTDQMVTLTAAGKPYLLAKSDTINVTPLDKSAAYLTQQPQQLQQGQQGQQVGMPVMQQGGAQGVPAFTLPNGRTLTAEQAQRFQSRMNNRFNGGGRGGGFGGNGGGNGGRRTRGGGGVMVAPAGG